MCYIYKMACQICSESESVDNVLIKSCFNDECDLKIHEKCLIKSVKNNKMSCQCGKEFNVDQFKKLNVLKCFSASFIYCYKVFLYFLISIMIPILEVGIDIGRDIFNLKLYEKNQFVCALLIIVVNIILIIFYVVGILFNILVFECDMMNVNLWVLHVVFVGIVLLIIVCHFIGWITLKMIFNITEFFTSRTFVCGLVDFAILAIVCFIIYLLHLAYKKYYEYIYKTYYDLNV